MTDATPAETIPADDARRDSPTPGEPAIDGDTSLDESAEAEESAPDVTDVDTGEPDADGEQTDSDDPTIEEVEVGDGDFGFAGDDRDEADNADTESESSDSTTSSPASESDGPLSVDGDKAEGIETAVNEGYARMLVVGLEDGDEKEKLEKEFAETFAAFRLGACASRFADEYIFTPGEDVDPAWALLGTVAISTAFATWMRPDGDEQVKKLTSAISGLLGTGGDA
ncbi:hypothetical protein [Haladaptatus cibarius]|uniref:hypothetical protein n=1 Tax=Haladaptatus cibarius TaxID=453847 RepID=UPI000678D7D2|nr:hypothetical protein [Haladaptatus cibarius]